MNRSQAFSQTLMAWGYFWPSGEAEKAARASNAASGSAAVQMVRSPAATAAAARRATGRSAVRIRWTLCRYRHKVHYPDTGVMPAPVLPALVSGGARAAGIGIIWRAAA